MNSSSTQESTSQLQSTNGSSSPIPSVQKHSAPLTELKYLYDKLQSILNYKGIGLYKIPADLWEEACSTLKLIENIFCDSNIHSSQSKERSNKSIQILAPSHFNKTSQTSQEDLVISPSPLPILRTSNCSNRSNPNIYLQLQEEEKTKSATALLFPKDFPVIEPGFQVKNLLSNAIPAKDFKINTTKKYQQRSSGGTSERGGTNQTSNHHLQ
ncbi:hypothetical protein AVEN_85778-1 [Araneus ventricosus]|uniref:Uncharacterized protein n=1 Tax=Araneus ventricosus TaxID=182803 RepID=A0A4Y2NVM0_ARAVE|nr:hypothetical protein AVEN_85778-1 [Araneus ventricosus]